MDKRTYLGLPDCIRLTNPDVELIVTTAVGPRIIRYGFLGGDNVLAELPDAVRETPLGPWKPWGGHRLWIAPEQMPRSYIPDNEPVEHEILTDRSVRLFRPADEATRVEKELTVTVAETGSGVTLLHRIANRGPGGLDASPWALTIMRGGGVAILPQEPFRLHAEHLLAPRTLVHWAYTDLTDPRWQVGRQFIRLRSDGARPGPQKIGLCNRQGWAAYLRDKTLFIKRFSYRDGAHYPDLGCNNEIFTAGDFIELESLGPLAHLEPGESAVHAERWELRQESIGMNDSDEQLDAVLTSAH